MKLIEYKQRLLRLNKIKKDKVRKKAQEKMLPLIKAWDQIDRIIHAIEAHAYYEVPREIHLCKQSIMKDLHIIDTELETQLRKLFTEYRKIQNIKKEEQSFYLIYINN